MLIAVGNPRTGADAFGALGLAHLVWRTWFGNLGLAALVWQPWFGSLPRGELGLAALRDGTLGHGTLGDGNQSLAFLGRHSCRDVVPSPHFDLAHCWLAHLVWRTWFGALGLAHLGVAHSDVAILDAPLEPRGVAMSVRDWAAGVCRTRLWRTGLSLTERRCFRVPLALSIEKLPRRG